MHPVFLHTVVGWGQFSVATLGLLQTKSPKEQLRSLEVLSCCQIRQFCWHKFGEGSPRRPIRGAGLQSARVKPVQEHIPEQITCRLWRGWGACRTALPGACTMGCLPTRFLPYLAEGHFWLLGGRLRAGHKQTPGLRWPPRDEDKTPGACFSQREAIPNEDTLIP